MSATAFQSTVSEPSPEALTSKSGDPVLGCSSVQRDAGVQCRSPDGILARHHQRVHIMIRRSGAELDLGDAAPPGHQRGAAARRNAVDADRMDDDGADRCSTCVGDGDVDDRHGPIRGRSRREVRRGRGDLQAGHRRDRCRLGGCARRRTRRRSSRRPSRARWCRWGRCSCRDSHRCRRGRRDPRRHTC
jgi:hypothetical protein